MFTSIDGTQLTANNYQQLLASDTYTLGLADYDSGNITANGQTVTLTKSVLSENPVYVNQTFNVSGHNIGYLMYNGFYPNYDNQLNAAFASLQSAGITDLILDLRYNSGGSVQTATYLASMITGQFTGQVFAKEQWNDKLMEYFAGNSPEQIVNNFTDSFSGQSINSLNLSRVYVLTSAGTASASELVINGLKPYIDVIQIGDDTVGKNVGSVTLYDSENFQRAGADPSHYYAMQPLVLKIVNRDNFGDYTNAKTPLLKNYIFSALAGTTWFLQFFFYGMGESKMGNGASSWILHMAFIILIANVWGLVLNEWKGVSKATLRTIIIGIATIIV
ncbi:MAG: hypothetical protein EOO68_38970, partial [Moraxellaceae bacterium]